METLSSVKLDFEMVQARPTAAAEDDNSAYDGSAAAEAAAVFGTDTQLLLSRPAPSQHPRLLASQDQQQ
ncbi:unnamed protein product [Plutella xylostella]|uniref:(diamondback moth) hypothetical protein n=1 Tax=Plutella xylostella TaxID=51655 RepID=A0A8S4GAQ9_PLUXY|nr:unnamed protein product [Plutella xylostella]